MSTEPDIPFTIGEWDFMLGKGYPAMFRGVEVVGLTNLHDGDDDDLGTVNMIDTEAWYQLQEIFNPWDLQKAVHKPTKTWVEWAIGTSWTSTHGPVVDTTDAEYDDYCVFSERVWDETEGELEVRRSWAPNDYNWYVDPATGKATITGLDSGHMYKIVYHTEPVVVGAFVKSLEAGMNVTPAEFEIEIPVFDTIADSWTDNLGVDHTLSVDQDIPFNITILDQTGTWTDSWTWSWTWDETDLKVYRENTMKSVIDDVMEPINATSMNDDFLVKDWDLDTVQKWCTASHDLAVTWPMEGETLHVNYLNHTIDVILTVEYNETGNWILWNYNVTVTAEYDEMLGGRWEHTVVGKDAHSVDSMGAALVTAAFKNKQIEIGIADMDMMADSEDLWVPQVMRYFGLTGLNDWDDYLDDLDKSISDPGKRASFKDDWCQTWQISYANIITIGGPLINLASYYFNDFTEAFYGIPEFTPSVWSGAVAASTCWNKNYYYSGPDKGYAVIGTYKDINGTIGLSIWGVWGRDTYYASRFFHEELIYEFQGFDPCITSVIIEIDYTDPDHPCFDIVETLGTISEHSEWTEMWDARAWLNSYYWWAYPTGPEGCCTIEKGGIHDP
jgi:predicted secreted protein